MLKLAANRKKTISIDSAKITGKVRIPPCSDWIHNAVFYQIYPQTFYDSNGDGIGDFQGIIQKLDYVKSLGVDGIWLNPFVDSPFRDAGYDASDYYKVAPRYGTNKDAKRLFDEAHKRGLKVIFDYVISYTSSEHPWFKASCQPTPNKYSNWYIWTSGTWFPGMEKYTDKYIQGYCERDGNYKANFFYHQPALNFGFADPDPKQPWQLSINHPDVIAMKKELKKVFRFWMDMGADGFRADMAGALVKDDTKNKTALFWKDIHNILNEEYPGSFTVAEWSNPKSAVKGGFHADFFHWFPQYSDLLHKENSKLAFFSPKGKGNICEFLKAYMKQLKLTQGRMYVCVPIGNHDLSRIRNYGRSFEDLEVIFAFLLTMPGIPFIYYGDEIGMRQVNVLRKKEGAYGGRAGDRTPMQWTSGKNAGFSAASTEKLYFPVDSAKDAPNVADEEKEQNSLLNRVRKLIQLRKQEKAFNAYAEFVPVYAKENKYPFIYARACGNEAVLVILNPAAKSAQAKFSLKPAIKRYKLLAGKESQIKIRENTCQVAIPGRSYSIYKLIK